MNCSLAMVGAALSAQGLCPCQAFYAVVTSSSFGRLLPAIAKGRKQRAMVAAAKFSQAFAHPIANA